MSSFHFEETKNQYGLFAYKIGNKRPSSVFFWLLIPFWTFVFLVVEVFLCLCFIMCAVADTDDAVGDYISKWTAIDDWFWNRNCPT
jgi:hypothetical protein